MTEALDQRETITTALGEAGFTFCALDLSGLRSGGMNALLSLRPAGDR